MEKLFTFFNLNLSNYNTREDTLFDSEIYTTFMKMLWLLFYYA